MKDIEFEQNYLENLIRMVKTQDIRTMTLVAAKELCEVILSVNAEPLNLLKQNAADIRQLIVEALQNGDEWISAAKEKPKLDEPVLCIVRDREYTYGEDGCYTKGGYCYYYAVGYMQEWEDEGKDSFIAWNVGVGGPVTDVLYWRELPEEPVGLEDELDAEA